MTAWLRGSFFAELLAIGRRYAPPQPEQPLSEEWSVEQTARERFARLAARVELERRSLVWAGETPEALVAEAAESAPTMVAAKQTLAPTTYDAMIAEQVELARSWGGDGPVRVEAEYIVIVARKRG
jgi:hypothetical protein